MIFSASLIVLISTTFQVKEGSRTGFFISWSKWIPFSCRATRRCFQFLLLESYILSGYCHIEQKKLQIAFALPPENLNHLNDFGQVVKCVVWISLPGDPLPDWQLAAEKHQRKHCSVSLQGRGPQQNGHWRLPGRKVSNTNDVPR